MPAPHFLSPPAPADTAEARERPDAFGPLQGGERVVWRGCCAVAEYGFEDASSPPRWTLPETTMVLVTDRRVLYTHAATGGREAATGELRWLWPQHLSVQPGIRAAGRAAAAPQIQLICVSTDGSFPALIFAGGDLVTVGDADKLANHLRHAIARFRLDHAERLGLSTPQARMLSRLLIGPEFSNFQGGAGQTVTLLGALPVTRPAPAPAERDPARFITIADADHAAAVGAKYAALLQADYAASVQAGYAPVQPYREKGEEAPTRVPGHRPGRAADEARAQEAAAAEEATQLTQPELASRAADLAARVADLVSGVATPLRTGSPAHQGVGPGPEASGRAHQTVGPGSQAGGPAAETGEPVWAAGDPAWASSPDPAWRSGGPGTLSAEPDSDDVPTTDLTARAENVRRAAARFAANSAKGKVRSRHSERETGFGNRAR
jgi:hypothetical protein